MRTMSSVHVVSGERTNTLRNKRLSAYTKIKFMQRLQYVIPDQRIWVYFVHCCDPVVRMLTGMFTLSSNMLKCIVLDQQQICAYSLV